MKSPAYHLRVFIRVAFVLSCLLIQTSCVSIGLPSANVVPAENLTISEPVSPFVTKEMPGIQKAWKSETTANIISVISNCSNTNDPALETLQTDAMGAFDNYTIVETHEQSFNDRKAIRTLIKGDIEGVPVMMDLLVFKKNGCRFTLTYSGKSSHFGDERDFFNRFVDGFKTP